MKILVVDDNKMVLKAIGFSLEAKGYEVALVDNSVKAIGELEKGDVDLVVSDIMMPGMSGLELLSVLKNFYLNRIPIIIISSLDNAEVALRSMGLGAEYFLPKPIDLNQLSECIKKLEKPKVNS